MTNYRVQQRNALLYWHIRNADQPGVAFSVSKNQFSEISVYCNQYPV